ncbi:hypothetical protein J3458_005773 [Metarhizium acridum]|uniref:uncharacterized protein n=1 Tax=Metarhizium acridum TaxID=92637 RepID=UPI001C6C63AA|nr:hypothetical protein J3458_005773 [Metarhizium acridum]
MKLGGMHVVDEGVFDVGIDNCKRSRATRLKRYVVIPAMTHCWFAAKSGRYRVQAQIASPAYWVGRQNKSTKVEEPNVGRFDLQKMRFKHFEDIRVFSLNILFCFRSLPFYIIQVLGCTVKKSANQGFRAQAQ